MAAVPEELVLASLLLRLLLELVLIPWKTHGSFTFLLMPESGNRNHSARVGEVMGNKKANVFALSQNALRLIPRLLTNTTKKLCRIAAVVSLIAGIAPHCLVSVRKNKALVSVYQSTDLGDNEPDAVLSPLLEQPCYAEGSAANGSTASGRLRESLWGGAGDARKHQIISS